MPFVTMTAPAVGDPTRQDWAQLVTDNLNILGSVSASSSLLNGSFETGSGSGDPSGWVGVRAVGTNTSISTADADVQHGLQALKMTTPGGFLGGITMTSDQFYVCGNGKPFGLGWFLKSTSATSSVSVKVRWYDSASSVVSTSTLYTATAAIPTAWKYMAATCTPPATAKQFKIILTGVDNATAADNFWDGVHIFDSKDLQTFIFTASGTYTPSKGVNRIHARAWGGGGGGEGGTSGAGGAGAAGGTGGATTVGGVTIAQGAYGGNGGAAAVVGASIANPLLGGSMGGVGQAAGVGGTNNFPQHFFSIYGGAGGAAGGGGAGGGGVAGAANTGAAGGGGGGGGANAGGGSGGHGCYGEGWIDVTIVALTVTLGAGGAGGAGGAAAPAGGNGGAGAGGLVIIQELA